ncbi:kinase-like domain-containing protein [Microdochium trichocladiopsis]|uniref:non-specific serine/threonine protein kinase n=1 Tax=Microdochium trichocladiopsis TaxID=1682393 RepID=A0A9P8YGC9_9PEZI|nr:kinase-like domain-containing protein [Microdochium trichocladiopsis]KAH7037575.1 kinase-like domain-containing protein [Microdochium trichocladiopsis]
MTESDKYEVLEKIGHGSFGVIRKVRRKADGMVLCRKEISYLKMSQKEREQLHAEFQILSGLKHPNIVGYYHREHLKLSQDLHLYMEYCGNGDLGRVIRDLAHKNQYAEEMFVWSMFSQLVTALYRCHYGVDPPEVGKNVLGLGPVAKPKSPPGAMTILHRDLKPENVFLGEDNSVKLGDFGLSKMIQSHDFASTYVGTPFYMSPEICAAEKYTLKSDIWSLGCIMYELCTREPPFNAKSHFQLVQKIKEGKIAPLPRCYSGELFAVIKDCLKVNPDLRPDTAALLNMPVVRLMRKEKEAVEVSRMLRNKEEALNSRIRDMEQKMASERQLMRQELESSLRREWETKAQLEINRHVNAEIARLQAQFEHEVKQKVDERVQQFMDAQRKTSTPTEGEDDDEDLASSLARSDFPQSIGAGSTDGEFPSTTDITEFDPDSPTPVPEPAPTFKKARTPFHRAATIAAPIGTPMDVEMASPSPIAIASLSLSPRRNNTTKAPSANAPSIFGDDVKRSGSREPELLEVESDDSGDEGFAPPSPTRMPRSKTNPFGPNRPVLTSTKTAPVARLKTQGAFGLNKAIPSLPPASAGGDTQIRAHNSNGALRERANSPNRRLSKIPSAAALASLAAESGLQRTSSLKKETESGLKTGAAKNNVKGRTLVELQQARAGGRPVENSNVSPKRTFKERVMGKHEPAAVWDPERDEMPSPFLVRTKPMTRC